MQKLVQGIHDFQNNIFASQREFFERLSHGQNPLALFITCSDSRVNPNLITQTDPGDLFILRNAGNIIPPYGAPGGGEAATIEFAVSVLGVQDIIVCGHSLCGAMKGVLQPETVQHLPALADWLNKAEATRRIMTDCYQHLSGNELLTATVQENVLNQIENLRTHPAVAVALSRKAVRLHGWVYKFETGQVFAFDPSTRQFAPLAKPELENLEPSSGDGQSRARMMTQPIELVGSNTAPHA